jgi:hypothetical protein
MPEETQMSHADRVKPKGPRPEILYDDGHGTRAALWHNNGRFGPFESIELTRPVPKKDGSGGVEDETFHLGEKHFDGVLEAILKAKEVAKARQESQGQSR